MAANSNSRSELRSLSRAVSHALRHEPDNSGLAIDSEGWVPVDILIEALRQVLPEWRHLTVSDLEDMIRLSDKIRHEIRGHRIRALYGHSVSKRRLDRKSAEPPDLLFHGTNEDAFRRISREGLKAMTRQHVHLSVDKETAWTVALRKTPVPVILQIKAGLAHRSGISFFHGNNSIWLVDSVPSDFIIRE